MASLYRITSGFSFLSHKRQGSCIFNVHFPIKCKSQQSLSSNINAIWLYKKSFASTSTTSSASWIDNSSWIHPKVRPYLHLARVDKQVGTMLLLWPCFWSTALAAPLGSFPDLIIMMKFGIGAFIMRGAGCTINDLWDKDFDKHVERTKNRPLASGELSTNQAILFLGFQLLSGLGVLTTFNSSSIILGIASMPLVIIYPLMKRFTYFPQFILGLAFNWGALMGWTAVHGVTPIENVLPLYISGICWTLVYDTLYGYQDIKDDTKLGLKSTAIYFGEKPQWSLTYIAAGSTIGLLLAGYNTNLTMPFYIATTIISSHLFWQIWTADIADPKNLWDRFSSNKYLGAAIFGAIVAGHF